MLIAQWKKSWLKWIIVSGCMFSAANVFAAPFNGIFYLSPGVQYSSYYIDKVKYQGMNLRLAAGYGGMANEYIYVGAELFGMPFTSNLNNRPNKIDSLKTSYSFGASFLPGVNLDDDVRMYLRLSYIATRFEKIPTTKAGYEAGLGVSFCWNANWDAFGEYIYAKYRTINNLGAPKAGNYLIGLRYKFA